eukprot:TRINITY_DN2838_c0_g1_i7.p2 TRINITY_DN2838_c0_g1~~TRINITY_DN2838_c0_g1_i7.p2  ORF type:complete len:191 (-),score=22.20 TRINITY_DN2838_c0_g1_i7:72-644(-)
MRSIHDMHNAALSLLYSWGLAHTFTSVGKVFAGRYRPNYLDMLEDLSISGDSDKEWNGRMSFPSGHATIMFAGCTWMALYMAGKLKCFTNKGGEAWKSALCVGPLMAAWLGAITRTRDYHHDFSDILAGSIIGACGAFVSYFCYFRSVFDKKCHLPKVRTHCGVCIDHCPNAVPARFTKNRRRAPTGLPS